MLWHVQVDGIGVYKFQLDYATPLEQAIKVRRCFPAPLALLARQAAC